MNHLTRLLALSALVGSSVGTFAACSSSDTTPAAAPSTDGGGGGTTDSAVGADTGPVDLVTMGAGVATTLGCHDCHDSSSGIMAGSTSMGIMRTTPDGGAPTVVFAANLTPDDDTGLGHADGGWDDTQLARAIRTGVDDGCAELCQVMPRFTVSDPDMTALIAYLRSLTPVKNSVEMQGCPSLNATNGAGGASVPGLTDCASDDDDEDAGPADSGTPIADASDAG